MKVIVVLSDSVNRRYLPVYGNEWVKTPNIDRFAKRSTVLNNHWCGSAPCMPARRDMFTGRYNFLERGWGGIEPYDYTLQQVLRNNGIYTTMFTDHYHYLETGGENYCQLFDTWNCIRGQEMDAFPGSITIEKENSPYLGVKNKQHERNKRHYRSEEDYPTPKTFREAVKWLESNKDEDDYLLWIEGFDPHEPFDVPEDYIAAYDDYYQGPAYEWPKYQPVDVPDEALVHIQNKYAATLTMMDKWFGKVLDFFDDNNFWDDTLILFTTDHGFMLGEHGLMGKNYMAAYNEVFHIPMIIYHPEYSTRKKSIECITQNIDIMPTILEYLGIDESHLRNKISGKSLIPLLSGKEEKIRDAAIYGYYGRNVNVTDGEYTYFRAAVKEDNSPLNLYGSVMTSLWQVYGHDTLINFQDIEVGRFLPWTDYPVYKIPSSLIKVKDPVQDFCKRNSYNSENMLFDIREDYNQKIPLDNEDLENRMIDLLVGCMKEADAPVEQYKRLGVENRDSI